MSDEKKNDGETGKSEIEAKRVEADPDTEKESGLTHLVSELKSIEQQVGEHVITALKHEGTAAVLTAVLPSGGGGGQRIASVPLDEELWLSVQELLMQADEEKTNDVPCIGFHCVLENRQKQAEQEKKKPASDNF
ncbi:MAG: hypothetical protein O7G85_14185 [Planctomycetota bacterium]|nr:hypothetical protein [Planctomycetota bacterium]